MSLRKICKIHGVAQSTLHVLIMKGKSFSGSGRSAKYLSKDEEDMLAEKTKSLFGAGFELTWANLQDLVREEFDSLVQRDPSRSHPPQNWPNIHYVRRYAKRNSLTQFITLVGPGRFPTINFEN